jgi:hypothetical protein
MGCLNTSPQSSTMSKRTLFNDSQTKKKKPDISSASNENASHLVPTSPENYILLWLTTNVDNFVEIHQTSIALFQGIIHLNKLFTDLNQCVDCISSFKDETVFLIVSEEIDRQAIFLMQSYSQVDSVYIYCRLRSTNDQSIELWTKVKGLYTSTEAICEALKQDIRLCNRNLMSINVVSQILTTHINELDPSLMYSQLLKEILLDIPHNDNEKKILVDFCSKQYAENSAQIKIFAEFEEKYDKPSPLWWYTRECFLYWMLNKALRTQDTETILKMGGFLRDLHYQIERLYLEIKPCDPITLFRGQGMLHTQFDKAKKNEGGLLSFNKFLSTSVDHQVGYIYIYIYVCG